MNTEAIIIVSAVLTFATLLLIAVIAVVDYVRRSRSEAKRRIPKAGETWISGDEDGSPWYVSPQRQWTVTVIDVRDDWVRYKFDGKNCLFQDERLPIDRFLSVYKLKTVD